MRNGKDNTESSVEPRRPAIGIRFTRRERELIDAAAQARHERPSSLARRGALNLALAIIEMASSVSPGADNG